ncbi:MAG: DNA translocase FtsK [Candidatus Vogelbacteria bacterium]|nr:DNA translocase FtsK [Candidatus Vogelbacteria bacterium]
MAKPSKLGTKNQKNSRQAAANSADLSREPRIKNETMHGIWAVLSFALAVFFALSAFSLAGKAGHFFYAIFHNFFGAGYFLVPTIFFMLGISFLRSIRPNFLFIRLLGGLIFFLASLGLVAVINEEAGGMIGRWIARPTVSIFDYYFSLVFFAALDLSACFVIFDTHLTLEPKLFWWHFGRQQNEGELAGEEGGENETETSTDKESAETEKVSDPSREDKEVKIKTGDEGLLSGLLSFSRRRGTDEFVPPPLSLLESDSGKPGVGDIKANSNIIKRTLQNFGINVEMDEITIGPSVTRYALKPAEGVKLSRIITLQNDLSLALAAHPLRIEAPIPGKSLVGIEIPNKVKSTVGLATLLGSRDFSDSIHPLYVSLGKGISGIPHFANLAKAPHMLIAGATGSGKSVTIHTIITSLLYRNSPDRLRFIMIDPKRVELTLYNGIPHLLTPVITDAKKTILALRWAAKEMDRRYDILEAHAVRDIQSYHKNILEKELAKKPTEGEEATEEIERMPYIAIIIDELADIMTAYPRELEAAIVRLAQMSRAVGIHLILSTQRPSVEVITGLIKANIPSRIALQVASQIDSRTIIDMAGAEKLLGAGDMLYLSGDMSKPIRIQSAFITEHELKGVVDYLKKNCADMPPTNLSLTGEEKGGGLFSTALDSLDGDDDMYEDARMSVIEAGKASASYLQRKLKVGYARAARLLDMLEERGVIGPGEGAKAREVYTKNEESPSGNEF